MLLVIAGMVALFNKETPSQETTLSEGQEVINDENITQEGLAETPEAVQAAGEEKVTLNQQKTMDTTKVTLNTTEGDIVLELYTTKVPKTAGNFVKLASEGFYDGVRFHRVIEGFMIQSGDPLSKDDSLQARWGQGDPGYKFDDEIVEGMSNVPGTISMANAGIQGGKGTNGSQFFINTGSNVFLDGKHSVFGKVIEGMEVVTAIEKTQTLPGDRPVNPITITSVSVEA